MRISDWSSDVCSSDLKTSITYEYPCADGDPYYPNPRSENQTLYKSYEALAAAQSEVIFVGRLATYRYYNMDQVVGQALATYRKLKLDTPVAGRATRVSTSPAMAQIAQLRSEERRVGKGCVGTCRSRWSTQR